MNAVLPGLLMAAVALGWARLALWQWRAPRDLRAREWRVAVLAALQPVCAGLLYSTLMPPATPGSAATLVVATANAPRMATSTVVALPESPDIVGAERAPDLAAALRTHPGTTRVQVVGGGLEARDRDAVRGLALAFDSPADRKGIVRLDPPQPVAPGGAFRVGGKVAGVPGGRVELLDPAGTRVDQRPLSPTGDFVVTGSARVAGVALVRIRIRDALGVLVEEASAPIRTTDDAQPRLLLLAGAVGPEVKYLRRWATDAGLAVTTRITAGGGAVLGDAAVPLDATTLARFDAAVVDERSWAGLGAGQRAAVIAAVRGGMGLVVRVTGAVPGATRGQWRALGVGIASAAATAPVPLGEGVPMLTRRVVGSSANAVPVWRDARGSVLADWRAVGRGRVALWTVENAFALVLSGEADRYAEAWGATLAAISRARGAPPAEIPPLPRAGERMTLCGIGADARVAAPGGNAALLLDPASVCAGYWPRVPGWHRLVRGDTVQPFYVYAHDALPGVRALDRAEATAQLRRASSLARSAGPDARGASWPWFLALLVAAGALWWFERARWGRRTLAAPANGAISA